MRQLLLSMAGLALLYCFVARAEAAPTDDGDDSPPPKKKENTGWLPWWPSSKKADDLVQSQAKESERSGEFPSWGVVKGKKDPMTNKSDEAELVSEDQKHKAQAEKAMGMRAQEQDKLLRRLAVCDQIRMMASKSDNDELLRQADRLDEQVRAAYARRIAHLPASHVSVHVEVAPTKRKASTGPHAEDGVRRADGRTDQASLTSAQEEKP
jgi:hypothetical protein